MNQCKIAQEVNNSICEAVNCFSPAEVQLKVKVGQLGNISLFLCNDCVRKFSEENEIQYKNLKVSATRNVEGD